MNEKVLVVDDEKEIADLLEVYLKNDGYTVYKFYNGTDALKCIRETDLDLAILDVMLPDIDGFHICQQLREEFFFPVIMLTAKVTDGDKIMGLTIGADDYITKPFNPLEVVARVKTQLRRYVRYNQPINKQALENIEYDKWQRKKLFYLKMQMDGSRYAKSKAKALLPYKVYETSSLMMNANSGFDMKYQRNKVHNLKLAATTIDKIAIKPNETFSFWQLVRWADRQEKYKDGLNFVNGKIVGSYGGGLCQLSNMLFWLFLHTPLTVIERHGHAVESFPSTTEELPCGTDATINEGWLDLKICNDTDNTFQVVVEFDDEYMYGSILSQNSVNMEYKVYNSSVSYVRENGKVYQIASVCRTEKDITTGKDSQKELYINRCEIGYELDGEIEIEERGANDD